MEYDRAQLEARLQSLPRGLLEHCLRVSRLCVELARRFGVSPEKAELAGLAHDLARARSQAELLDLARSHGLVPNEAEQKAPILLHGPVAAAMLKELGMDDAEVLEAVACHTTGRPNMTPLDKVLFLADKLEEGKESYHPELARVRQLAERDLDLAVRELLKHQVATLQRLKAPLHPATLAALKELEEGTTIYGTRHAPSLLTL